MTDTRCKHCGSWECQPAQQPDAGRLDEAALDAIGRMLEYSLDMTNHAKLTMDYSRLSKTTAMLLAECRALMSERDEIAADLAEYLKEDYEAHKGDFRRDQWVDCLAQELADVKTERDNLLLVNAALDQETEAGPLQLRDFAREQVAVFAALEEFEARLRALEVGQENEWEFCPKCKSDDIGRTGHDIYDGELCGEYACAQCNNEWELVSGTGKLRRDTPPPCEHCDGSGKQIVEWENCPECGGE